ncbi:uncharacterized protein LOC144163116 [Haemaphysalis longicornis]
MVNSVVGKTPPFSPKKPSASDRPAETTGSVVKPRTLRKDGMVTILEDLRRRQVFIDAEVVCTDDGSRFPVHWVLLYAASPFFRDQTDGGQCQDASETAATAKDSGGGSSGSLKAYPVDGVRGDVMAALLEYVYTSRVTLSTDNVLSMLLAAQRFQDAQRVTVFDTLALPPLWQRCPTVPSKLPLDDVPNGVMSRLARDAQWPLRCPPHLQ